ncbi:MAG: phytoene/squalene synthase family protein [Rhodospirillaceae bacterium]
MPATKTLSYCASLVERHNRDRFLTALFAPVAVRERLMTLYAFNVEIARIRETVTEPMIGQMRLQWWRDTLTAISEGKGPPKGHPVAESLADLVEGMKLSATYFHDLLAAREQDMEDEPPGTLDDLVEYCRGTSATLSHLALEALDVKDEKTHFAAENVGIAWALTGIARAVHFYAAAGRTFLPGEALTAHGLAIQDLQDPKTIGPAQGIIRDICALAHHHLQIARENRRAIDLRGLPVLLPATISTAYLKTLKEAEYKIADPRVALQKAPVARLWWNAWRKTY